MVSDRTFQHIPSNHQTEANAKVKTSDFLNTRIRAQRAAVLK